MEQRLANTAVRQRPFRNWHKRAGVRQLSTSVPGTRAGPMAAAAAAIGHVRYGLDDATAARLEDWALRAPR
eukprot:2462295-Alexandrium_andersonii.AAC.1